MLELVKPQHLDICLDVKPNPLCPYMSKMRKLACPTCDTVVVNLYCSFHYHLCRYTAERTTVQLVITLFTTLNISIISRQWIPTHNSVDAHNTLTSLQRYPKSTWEFGWFSCLSVSLSQLSLKLTLHLVIIRHCYLIINFKIKWNCLWIYRSTDFDKQRLSKKLLWNFQIAKLLDG